MSKTTSQSTELWTNVQPDASRRLLLAALDAFARHGYYGATTRVIAQGAGMSPAAVYVHYRSKADLLYEMGRTGHEAVLHAVEQALDGATEPAERLQRFVAAFASFHARHHTLARVIQYELRALSAERFREIGAIRRRFEELVQDELRSGIEAGQFAVDDVPGTALAILSLGIDVARWYTDRAGTSPQALGALYADLVLRMVGNRP